MGLISRNTAFALAAIVLAFLALARLTGDRRIDPAPAVTPAVERVVVPVIPVRRKAAVPRKVAAAPAPPAKVRGAALRDPGEAFGGRAPHRVDKSTSAPQ